MKPLTRIILMVALAALLPATAQANRRITIKSDPSGATVELGNLSGTDRISPVGTTPLSNEISDSWFDGPSAADGRYLNEPSWLIVSKPGYETKTQLVTKGPLELISSDGKQKVIYYVMIATEFDFTLEPLKGSAKRPQPLPFVAPLNAGWYKRASDQVNQNAKLLLERALSEDPAKADLESLFVSAIICGPNLWEALEARAPKELKESLKVSFIAGPPGTPGAPSREGRSFRTPEEKRIFWTNFMHAFRDGNSVTVRRINKPEMDYFWSVISFDVEEPLYVADLGKRSVLFYFVAEKDVPKAFWIDIVGEGH